MTHHHITPAEISVIVRGLIVGAHDPDPQKRFTERCIKSVRTYLPGAEVIVSTWSDQDIAGLDYDVVVVNDQPEPIYMTHPSGEVRHITTNNQIITSREGIARATRPYTLNIRSDLELSGVGFLNAFDTFNRGPAVGHVGKQIVVLPTYNPRRGLRYLYDVCDWFYFGQTDDIRDLFDIPLMQRAELKGTPLNGHPPVEENLGCEAYIWTRFLEKHGETTVPNQRFFSEETLRASERSYAQNTIMVPASKLHITCLKMPHAGYGARPWLSQGLYTFTEYKRLYNQYHAHKVPAYSNPFETLGYRAALLIRRMMRKLSPRFYKKIVNLVRQRHGSGNLLT